MYSVLDKLIMDLRILGADKPDASFKLERLERFIKDDLVFAEKIFQKLLLFSKIFDFLVGEPLTYFPVTSPALPLMRVTVFTLA